MGLNFLPVDYRGYGHSTSPRPSVSAMLRDAHVVFEYTRKWLQLNGCKGPLIVMGRSLGSASALELAEAVRTGSTASSSRAACLQTLLNLAGIDMKRAGIEESARLFATSRRSATTPGPPDHPRGVRSDPALLGRRGDSYRASGSADKRLLDPADPQQHLHGRPAGLPEGHERVRLASALRAFLPPSRFSFQACTGLAFLSAVKAPRIRPCGSSRHGQGPSGPADALNPETER